MEIRWNRFPDRFLTMIIIMGLTTVISLTSDEEQKQNLLRPELELDIFGILVKTLKTVQQYFTAELRATELQLALLKPILRQIMDSDRFLISLKNSMILKVKQNLV